MGSSPMDMDCEFDLESMPDDDLQSFSGSETSVSDDSHHEVSDDIKSSMPDLISHSLKTRLPGLISDALKDCLPQLLKESFTPFVLTISKSVSLWFVTLQQGLSKVLKIEMEQSISSKVSLGMQDVKNNINTQTKHLSKYYLSVQDMHSQLTGVRELLEAAVVMDDHAKGEKGKKEQRNENAQKD
ncbi:hypothetical protein Tco_1095884 [Tanacetum coccineum]